MGHFQRLAAVVAATLLLFNTFAAAQTSPDSPQKEDPDAKEMQAFRLTMPKLDQFEIATNGISKVLHDHPELKKKINEEPDAPADSGDKGEHKIDRTAKSIEAISEISAAVKESGLSVREYVVMTFTVVSTLVMVTLKKQGMIAEYPPNVSHENAAFIEHNFERVSKAMAPLMQNMVGGASDDTKDQDGEPKKDHPN
jgi:hypothetical protein